MIWRGFTKTTIFGNIHIDVFPFGTKGALPAIHYVSLAFWRLFTALVCVRWDFLKTADSTYSKLLKKIPWVVPPPSNSSK